MLLEPGRTRYDLEFRLLGIPVRVHPWFWIFSLIMASHRDVVGVLVWVAVVFVSILVHEMGHALVIRAKGHRPSITLYAMGGLASWSPSMGPPVSSAGMIQISFAGPAAGFLLAAAVIGALIGTGHGVALVGIPIRPGLPLADPVLRLAVFDLLFVNVFWGLVNLLPVYPLDGGQIAVAALGVRRAIPVSIAAGTAVAIAGIALLHEPFIAILFGVLAFENYQRLQLMRRPPMPW